MDIESTLIKKSSTILIVCGAVILLNILAYALGISRLDNLAGKKEQKVVSNKPVLARTKAERDKLAEMALRVQTGRDVIDNLNKNIFKTKGNRLVSVQDNIEKLALKNNIQTKTISYSYGSFPKTNKISGGWKHRYDVVSMSIPLTGSYPSIKSFIRDLQASDQFLIADALMLSSSTASGVLLRVNLSVKTYFLDKPEQSSAGGRDS